MDFKERIQKIIEYSKLSTSDFADAVDVPRSSISHIASGRNKPSLDFLVKIKTRFPELEWDWLISGAGEMKLPEPKTIENTENPSPTSLPDLFSIIDDENFGKTESDDKVQNEIPRESSKAESLPNKDKIADSQRLANEENVNFIQPIENQQNKIKRIVMFFENGKFESFEP